VKGLRVTMRSIQGDIDCRFVILSGTRDLAVMREAKDLYERKAIRDFAGSKGSSESNYLRVSLDLFPY
jgi:hypothetical protein